MAKKNCNWILKYVKGAIGETDVPDALPEFISQRRRWLNGSFFAATYAIAHVGQIMSSGHSFARKFMLMVETVYNIVNLIFSWFAIVSLSLLSFHLMRILKLDIYCKGNFYLFFVVLTTSLEDGSFGLKGISYWNTVVQFIMGALVVACFLISMNNKPRQSELKYQIMTGCMATIMVYLLFASIKCGVQAAKEGGAANSTMVFSVLITYGCKWSVLLCDVSSSSVLAVYAFSSFLALDPWHMFTSFVPYLLLSPMYINVLNMWVVLYFSLFTCADLSFHSFAFCNLDDISWGTKQDSTPETDLGAVLQDSHSQVDIEMLTEPVDMNSIYEESLANLRDRVPIESGKPNKGLPSAAEKEAAAKDYYATVRTNVLLAWVLSNVSGLKYLGPGCERDRKLTMPSVQGLLLVIILSNNAPDTFSPGNGITKTKGYLLMILAFTAIMNLIVSHFSSLDHRKLMFEQRFTGSTLYLLARLITG